MGKLNIIIICLLCVFGLSTAVKAQNDGPETVRIGVVDTEKILSSSAAGRTALADLKKFQDSVQNQITGQQQAIKGLQTRINEGRSSMSPDELSSLQRELESKTAALRRLQDDAQRNMTKKRDEMLGEIDKKVMPVINRIGEEMGYTLIFRKFESGLIFASKAVDITDLVIERLDEGK